MSSSFSDLRFTDSIEYCSNSWSLNYSYFIENYSASNWAKIWVKIDNLPALTNKTIYAYYNNNGSLSSLSSGSNTFLEFADFESNTTDGFNGGSVITNSSAYEYNNFLESATTISKYFSYDYKNITFHGCIKGGGDSGYVSIYDSSNNSQSLMTISQAYSNWYKYNTGGSGQIFTTYTGAWNCWDIQRNDSAWVNLTAIKEFTNVTTNMDNTHGFRGIRFFLYSPARDWWDLIYVRNWRPNEPTGLIGSSQISSNLTFSNTSKLKTIISKNICIDNDCLLFNTTQNKTCVYGCDNITNTCYPPPFQQDIINFVILMGIITITIIAIKRLR